jgi:uncharacterized protein (UPF0297 family)
VTEILSASKNRQELLEVNESMNDVIADLDERLLKVLRQQETDYLKGYAVYVAEKENELRNLINKLNDKSSDEFLKEEII